MSWSSLLLVACCIAVASAFYSKTSDVVSLTEMNSVLKDDAVWIVEFYAPWCGHCKSAKPEYEKAAKALKGIAKVGAVDMTVHQALGQPYGVQGFPTFKIFVGGKAQDYNGQRTAAGIVDGVTGAIRNFAKARLGGSSSSSGSSSGGSKKKSSGGAPVEELGDSDFESTVMNSEDMFVVAFVAPWCGHCKNLHPEFDSAARKLDGSGIRLVRVDATQNNQLASKFKVQGYPTIKVFPPGPKSDNNVMDYQGPRDADGITNYAQNQFEKLGGQIKVDLNQLTGQSVFEKSCNGQAKKCVVVFLPGLYDEDAKARNARLEKLKNVAKQNRHMPMLWASANDQPNFEDQYQLTAGFPAIVMLRDIQGDKVGFVYRGKFLESDISAWITAPKSPSAGVAGKYPTVSKVKAWDGKDMEKLVDEDDDFDLQEFLKD